MRVVPQFRHWRRNKIGPALWGIVDRDIAASTGFNYSSALSGKDGIWDYEALNGFLENPKKYATGTNMAFAGYAKPKTVPTSLPIWTA